MVRGIQSLDRGPEPFTVNREPDTLQGEQSDPRPWPVARASWPIDGPLGISDIIHRWYLYRAFYNAQWPVIRGPWPYGRITFIRGPMPNRGYPNTMYGVLGVTCHSL